MSNKSKTLVDKQVEHDVENNITEAPKAKTKINTRYTVEMVASNQVWLRKDYKTVVRLVGHFDYKVGDIVKI